MMYQPNQMNQQFQSQITTQAYNIANTTKYKTMLCRHFKNGNCTLSDQCHFAHGMQELRNANSPLPQNLPPVYPKVTVNNYKTVRCRYYDNGYCKNGPQCSFAHGDQDVKATGMMGNQYNNYNYQYQMDPNIQILIMILQNLEQVFPGQAQILEQLHMAQNAAQQGDPKQASNIIMQIMNDSARSAQEKQMYQTIYQNAQIYLNTQLCNPNIIPQNQMYQPVVQQNNQQLMMSQPLPQQQPAAQPQTQSTPLQQPHTQTQTSVQQTQPIQNNQQQQNQQANFQQQPPTQSQNNFYQNDQEVQFKNAQQIQQQQQPQQQQPNQYMNNNFKAQQGFQQQEF